MKQKHIVTYDPTSSYKRQLLVPTSLQSVFDQQFTKGQQLKYFADHILQKTNGLQVTLKVTKQATTDFKIG